MKNIKINYRIQRKSFENSLEISINVEELEKNGLTGYLYQNGLIGSITEDYNILNRFIIFSKIENKNTPITHSINRKNNFENRREIPTKKYRVDLHSNEYFKNIDSQRFVDVIAMTRGKAIMIAMNKIGFTDFPENWGNISILPGHKLGDFGLYTLDDDNNPFIKRKEQEQHTD